jgi:peroxiredoxin
MRRFIFSVFLIVLSMNSFPQIMPGMPAAELSLPDANGNPVNLSELKGKVVLLDFWASWCGPCRRNSPHLVRLYKKYHEKGLEILGVSLDQDPASWKDAIHHDKMNWIQVNDDKGWNAPSTITYQVNAIPAYFLIDKNGIIKLINGSGQQLEDAIKELL